MIEVSELEEQWKPVYGWPGYMVSNLGEIKSYKVDTVDGRTLSASLRGRSYAVTMHKCVDNVKSIWKRSVKALVLDAFGNPEDKLRYIVNLDGNALNNRIDNLEYSSYPNTLRSCHSRHKLFNPVTDTTPNGLRYLLKDESGDITHTNLTAYAVAKIILVSEGTPRELLRIKSNRLSSSIRNRISSGNTSVFRGHYIEFDEENC